MATAAAASRRFPLLARAARPRQQHLPSRQPHTAARHASSSSTGPQASSSPSGTKAAFYATSLALTGYLAYVYTTDTRAFVHRYIVPRLLRTVIPDAEEAHHAAVSSMKNLYALGLHPRERPSAAGATDISQSVYGIPLANPLGISAGLDKHAEIPDALFALGASVVEVGGCTPLPQDGNPRPRMFRIPGIDGLINRYGLNSRGADNMAMRLRDRVRRFARSVGLDETAVLNGEAGVPPGSLSPGRMLLVQIAKNKDTDGGNVEAVQRDYVYCVQRLARYADVLVVNVSSPNTPGLRDLQATEPLTRILGAVVEEAHRADRSVKPRVMVKVSPDEAEDAQVEGIVQAVYASGVDGVIVGNTTKRRADVVPPGIQLTPEEQATMGETGGYSGPMLFDNTADLVKRYRKMLDEFSRNGGPVKKVAKDEAVNTSLAAIEGSITGVADDTTPTSRPGPGPAKSPVTTAAEGQQQPEQKVIFATGGITNGEQALKVLNAGASVAMVYTSLVYGGAGTITRMKGEMREQIQANSDAKVSSDARSSSETPSA